MADLLSFPQTPADLLLAADKAVRRGDLRTAIRLAERALRDEKCVTSSTMAKVRELIAEMKAQVDQDDRGGAA